MQRFGGAINLNVHFHSLVLDGVYCADAGQRIRFQRLPPPSDPEVRRVTTGIARRIIRLIERRGLGPQADPDEADPLLRNQPLLAELYSASVQGRIATGARAGNRITSVGFQAETENDGSMIRPRRDHVSGFSLHANVCIPPKARHQLENLCRYAARPAVATERLSMLPSGRVIYRLRHHWRDRTTHLLFEPIELVEKLAALVPPPRFNLVRYNGIFAPAARWRSQVVPCDNDESTFTYHTGCLAKKQGKNPDGRSFKKTGRCHPRNYSWAELMKRVFELDLLEYPKCGGRMRILCAINPPDAIKKILDCLGLPSRPPPISPAVLDHYLSS